MSMRPVATTQPQNIISLTKKAESIIINSIAVVAQLDRASGCGPEGRRFESRRLHHILI
jgi:hypothetical protein